MTPKILLRVAAFLTLFVTVGHTIGHFTRKDTRDASVKEVIKQMETVKINFNGSIRTWDAFYAGLSLDASVSLLAFFWILWILSTYATKFPVLTLKILWPVLFCFIGFTITGFMYFFVVPAVSTLLVCLLIIAAQLHLAQLKANDHAV